MPAKTVTVNFSTVPNIRLHASGVMRDPQNAEDPRPTTAEGKLLTAKQIRARARRKAAKTSKRARNGEILTELEFETLYKPIEDWDLEELAHGRPRDIDGAFKGRKPQWITREVHERAMEQFQLAIKQEMGVQGLSALSTIQFVLESNDIDDRGKPVVNAATKLQASTFLLEHIIGKPKQRVEQDISVKLEGILGQVMVNPTAHVDEKGNSYGQLETGPGESYSLAHFPGHTIPIGIEADKEDIVEGEWSESDGE